MTFILDPQLENDTWFICDLHLCSVRLHKNATWPWIILVPRRADVYDMTDLTAADQGELMREIDKVAKVLKTMTTPDKLNIASIGNMVRQLHVHIVARRVGDPGWPAPIWGQPYTNGYGARQKEDLIKWLYDALHH